jgi:hypothetical protein
MANFSDAAPRGLEPRRTPIHRRPERWPSDLYWLPEEEQEQLAAGINARMTQLKSEGFRDTALLSLMVNHARNCHRLIWGTPLERWHELILQYPGLCQFAFMLTNLQFHNRPDQWPW